MSTTAPPLDSLAERMLADYDAVNPGTVFKEGLRLQINDALRLQTAVTHLREARGETVIGYKIGCVAPGNQKMMGLDHPVWGRLWKREAHKDGVTLDKADYANIAVEAEFGVRFKSDLQPGMTLEEITVSVDTVFPLLELHNLVMHSEPPHGHELIANNAINCGLVAGAPALRPEQELKTDLELIYDDKIVDSWSSLSWPDDIIGAVPLLIDALHKHGLGLRAGDIALTGAWGPPIPVNQHQHVQVKSSGFGDVSAKFK